MGDILSVGQNQNCLKEQEQWIDTSNFLQKDQYLGEFSNEFPGPNGETVDEKKIVRENLEVYSQDDVDDLIDRRIDEELDNLIDLSDDNYQEFRNFLYNAIKTRIDNYANTVNNTLQGYIKKDGSVPFIGKQSGVTPTASNHLATKSYVDRTAIPKVQEYLDSNEFKSFVDQTIGDYVKVYIPEELIQLKGEIEQQIQQVISEQDNNELVISAALNNLNDRIIELNNLLNESITNSTTELNTTINNKTDRLREDLINEIISNELVVSTSLNDLNKRIISQNNSIQDVSSKFNNYSKKLLINGKTPVQYNELEINLLNFIAESSRLYNILQFFSSFSQVNIITQTNSPDSFTLQFVMENNDIAIYTVSYDEHDNITVSGGTGSGNSPLLSNFVSIIDTALTEFVETITKTIYTENFYSE